MLTWNGQPLSPDPMPEWLRREYECEQALIDVQEWIDTLREIQSLPEVSA